MNNILTYCYLPPWHNMASDQGCANKIFLSLDNPFPVAESKEIRNFLSSGALDKECIQQPGLSLVADNRLL